MRWIADRSLRRSNGGRVVLGGSPLKLFRLSAGGARVLDSALAGSLPEPTPTQAALLDRLVAAGAIHPDPLLGVGPYGESDVTVVVPVRGGQSSLDRLLRAIGSSSPGIRKIVVVDDGSATPLGIEHLTTGAVCPVVLHRRPTSGGPGVARNEGLALVDTALVAFVDVDCEPTPGWLEPLLAHLADPTVAVVAPRIVAIDHPGDRGDHPIRRALFAYERSSSPLDLGGEPARVSPGTRVSYVPTAALLARTEAVRASGGFDPAMRVGEDVDLIWRLVDRGERVRYEPAATVGHQIRLSLTAWLKQRFTYGTSAAPLAELHGHAVAPVVISPWSVAVWVLVALGQPAPAVGLALGTTAELRSKLPDVDPVEVIRLGLGGHLGAGAQLARATVRVWWPVAIVGSLFSRRVRRVAAVAVLWSMAVSGERTPLGAAISLLDDATYGAGVWRGWLRSPSRRSLRALLPSVSGSRTAI